MEDQSPGEAFVVDTGSEISVYPKRTGDNLTATSKHVLTVPNNSKITTYSEMQLTLYLDSNFNPTWTFVVADVPGPIIGADFLCNYRLISDLINCRLVPVLTERILPTTSSVSGHTQCDVPWLSARRCPALLLRLPIRDILL